MLKRIQEFLSRKNIHDIQCIYMYGSRVYGTFTSNSDHDFIVVTASDTFDGEEFRNGELNIHIYSVEHFQQNLSDHKITALECFFLPSEYKLLENVKFNFKLNFQLLRTEISSKASNSWVKAKKKLELVDEDNWIGVKSLFHSFRIINFGIQIATSGAITNYSASNTIWDDVKNISYSTMRWDIFYNLFKDLHNKLMSDFRAVAPKS